MAVARAEEARGAAMKVAAAGAAEVAEVAVARAEEARGVAMGVAAAGAAEVGATAVAGGRAEAIQAGRRRGHRRHACGAASASAHRDRRRDGRPAARSRSICTARGSRRGTPRRGRPPPARSRSRPRPCRLVVGAEGQAKVGVGVPRPPAATAAQTCVEER